MIGKLTTIALSCCPRCGFAPIEGMARYLEIHGEDARCINPACGKRFAWYRASTPSEGK